jgi:NAD(P)-dependent dehydrogenase (short-subunit alcohol dehydrogenase family)
MKTFDIAGRVALVTGASSGLGEHFARLLASEGAVVILAARRVDRLEKLASEIASTGGKAHAIAMDVTSAASVEAAFAKIASLGLVPGIVVNNAGIAQGKPSIELTEADWRSTMDTNIDGAWRVAQAAAKAMLAAKQPGTLINITSILGLRVGANLLSYTTAKAALVQLTKSLSLDWARYGIRVNAIAPGYIETDINRGFLESEGGQAMIRRIPMRRVGQAGDLDGALLLLASDAGSYMNGSIVVVDGGHSNSSL